MIRQTRSRRAVAAGLAAAGTGLIGVPLAHHLAFAQSTVRKPKPPTGLDPGGIAVALLGPGLDYRRADIARRLARDGEGELIAWDMVDNDARPLEGTQQPAVGGTISAPQLTGTRAAEVLISEAPASRLVPVRIADDSIRSLGAALAFASRTPARVAVLLTATREAPWPVFAEAAQRAKQLLVVAPAGRLADRTTWAATRAPDAAFVVTAVRKDGSAWISADDTPPWADLAVPVSAADLAGGGAQTDLAASVPAAEAMAALHLGALAARILARSPELDAAALKLRLLGLGKPRTSSGAGGGSTSSSSGSSSTSVRPPLWIADIAKLP